MAMSGTLTVVPRPEHGSKRRRFCDVRSAGVDRRGGAAVLGSVQGTSAGQQLPWQLLGNLLPDQHARGRYYTPEIPSFSMVFSALAFFWRPLVAENVSALKKKMRKTDILDFFPPLII